MTIVKYIEILQVKYRVKVIIMKNIYFVCSGEDYITITSGTDGNTNFKGRRKSSENTINTYRSIQQCFVLRAYLEKILYIIKKWSPRYNNRRKNRFLSQYSDSALNRNTENRQAIFLGFVGIFFSIRIRTIGYYFFNK